MGLLPHSYFSSYLKYKNIHLWAAAESTEASLEELFELGKGKTAKSLAGEAMVKWKNVHTLPVISNWKLKPQHLLSLMPLKA